MLSKFAKLLAMKAGVCLSSVDRFGAEVERDLKRLAAQSPLTTIFDVGANVGQTAIRFAEHFPSANIYSFEPAENSFNGLQQNCKSIKQVHPIHCALGDQIGTVDINVRANPRHNTIDGIKTELGSVQVRIDTVDHFAEQNHIGRIDLLKIDVEGHELAVCSGARASFEKELIRFVYAECWLSVNPEAPRTGTSFFELHALLESFGFCAVNFYAQSFYLKHGCAMGNALFASRKHLPTVVQGRIRNIY